MSLTPPVIETPIFQDENVTVTRTLIRVKAASYPINGIGSVDIQPPPKSGILAFAILSIAISLLILFSGGIAFGILMAAFGGFLLFRSTKLPSNLVLRTSSGDQQMLQSPNVIYLGRVKRAIEQAVVLRG